jgi:hypothetical protein
LCCSERHQPGRRPGLITALALAAIAFVYWFLPETNCARAKIQPPLTSLSMFAFAHQVSLELTDSNKYLI